MRRELYPPGIFWWDNGDADHQRILESSGHILSSSPYDNNRLDQSSPYKATDKKIGDDHRTVLGAKLQWQKQEFIYHMRQMVFTVRLLRNTGSEWSL